jgi:hypothetical protein
MKENARLSPGVFGRSSKLAAFAARNGPPDRFVSYC